MPTVVLPDGTQVENVPEGTTKAQLKEKLLKSGYPEEMFSGPSMSPREEVNPLRVAQGLPPERTLGETATKIGREIIGGVASVGSGAITAGAGVAQLGAEIGEFALALDPSASESVRNYELKRQQRFKSAREDFLQRESTAFESLLEGAGEFALPGAAVGASKRIGVVSRVLDNAARQGATGLIEFNETDTVSQRASNTLLSIAFGQGASLALETGRLLKNIIRPQGAKVTFVDSDLLTEKESQDVIRAAKDLGITVTPGEASGDIVLRAGEANLTVNKAGKKELVQFLQEREKQMVREIESLKGSALIGSSFEEHRLIQEQLYQKAATQTVDKRKLAKIVNNPNFTDVVKSLKADNPAAITKQVVERAGLEEGAALPPNSVAWLDRIKKEYDTLINKNTDARGLPISKEKQARLLSARKELNEFLKEQVPEYAEYTKVAQRAVAANKIEEALKLVPEKKALSPADHFFETVLNKPATREDLISSLEEVPLAQEKVRALTKVLGRLQKSGLRSNLNTDLLLRFGTAGQGFPGTVGINLATQVSGEFNRAVIEYITNPAWTDDISKIGKIGNAQKQVDAFVRFFAGVAAYREEKSRMLGELQLQVQQRDQAVQNLMERSTPLP